MAETYKILVAEDNDFVRMQIVNFLESAGYGVEEAVDGKQAAEKISSGDFDIAIAVVDVRMEPMDGFEFVRTIQSMGVDIPVILVTGDQNPELLSDASKLGVVAVMMKPVQKDRLLKTVERTIQSMGRD